MKRKKIKPTKLQLIQRASKLNLRYVVKGATVWLNSGSPALRVVSVRGSRVFVFYKDSKKSVRFLTHKSCLTPEPTPMKMI